MGFLDVLAGTFTFGQCNHNGCGGSHRGTSGFNPIGALVNHFQNIKPPSASGGDESFSDMLGLSDDDTKTLLELAGLGFLGLIIVIILIDLIVKII
jgi:hypothetical protein